MGTKQRHPRVVNVEDVDPRNVSKGGFGHRVRRLGAPAGAQSLGCSHLELAPGKTAFPFHFHSAFEEANLRAGRRGHRCASARTRWRCDLAITWRCRPGPDHAHALKNSGKSTLRYLCMSGPATPTTLDILVYPDSKKVAYASGVDPTRRTGRHRRGP